MIAGEGHLVPVTASFGGRYGSLRRLGGRDSTNVYLCTDTQAPRYRPVVVRSPTDPTDGVGVRREYGVLRVLRDVDGVVHVLDGHGCGPTTERRKGDGPPYFVEEYLGEHTLAEELYRHGKMDEGRIVGVSAQLCDALDAVHKKGLVHRDVNPDVIFLDGERVRLAGFGSARAMDDVEQDLLETGRRIGTPLYMSPEQISGDRVDPRTDVYVLGAVMYHMATGRPPFTGDTREEVMRAHLEQEPLSPRLAGDGITPGLDDVIMTALKKDPRERHRDMMTIRATLPGIEEMYGCRPARRSAVRRFFETAGQAAASMMF